MDAASHPNLQQENSVKLQAVTSHTSHGQNNVEESKQKECNTDWDMQETVKSSGTHENKPDVVDEYSPQVVHDTDFSCGKKKVIQYLIWTNILLLYNLKT